MQPRKMILIPAVGCQMFLSSIAAAQIPATLPATCEASTPAAIRAWVTHPLSCGFDRTTMRYAGSPAEQARCLLRHIRRGGHLDAQLERLPGSLESLIGTPTTITGAELAAHLTANGVSAEDVGGSLEAATSRTADGHGAAYFVIHDTSTPEYDLRPFGPEINDPDWRFSDPRIGQRGTRSKAHLYIARTGQSATAVNYGTAWRATKAELCVLLERSRGLYLHNEIIQPRRKSASDSYNDLAPEVAITPAQLDRLALAYVAASVRAGHWLIPAFHATVDEGLADGHDDPQGFDLADWAARIDRIRAELRSR